jgi:hypothetical protein
MILCRQLWRNGLGLALGLVVATTGAALSSSAQMIPATADVLTVESRSKHFVVSAPRSVHPAITAHTTTNQMRCEPNLLAVSCERIKKSLHVELGLADRWQLTTPAVGLHTKKVFLVVHPRVTLPVTVSAVEGARKTNYRIDLPIAVEPNELILGVVKVLLAELADPLGEHDLEFPRWLLEGLVAHLQSTSIDVLTLEQNAPLFINGTLDTTLRLRQFALHHDVLGFDELAFPTLISSERFKNYKSSAHLFVYELLGLRQGREAMQQFIREIPRHRNWQLAFLKAYSAHFKDMVQVEKWWALSLATFNGRDPRNLMAPAETARELEQLLYVPVYLHTTPNAMPERSMARLDEVVLQWDLKRQEMALQTILPKLARLRSRADQKYVSLIDEYQQVVQEFLSPDTSKKLQAKNHFTNPRLVKEAVARRLRELDAKRAALAKTDPVIQAQRNR